MVVRANSGMSISAAIRAAPTKKLTSSDPQAGVRAQRAGRDQRRVGPPQVQHEGDGGDGASRGGTRRPGRRRPGSWGRRWRRRGSRRPARRRGTARRPGRPRGRCGSSRGGRPADGGRWRSGRRTARAATIATTPERASASGSSPANGMNSWPQVRSRSSCEGWMKTSDAGDQGDEQEEGAEEVWSGPGWFRDRSLRAVPRPPMRRPTPAPGSPPRAPARRRG